MAKITVTLTAQYDDGKSIKEPGDTISIDDKLALQLAALGMVELSEKKAKAPKKASKKTGQKQDDDSDNLDPDNLDPDALGDE